MCVSLVCVCETGETDRDRANGPELHAKVLEF